MFDKHYVGLNLTAFQNNGTMRPISRVTLAIDDERALTAGDDSGLEIKANCPHATQAMVNAILARVRGYEYRTFTADAASIDPAAELGDGVTAGGMYSVLSKLDDDGLGYPGISAPGEAELEDEYPSAGPMTQEFNRKLAQTRSSITKTAEQIRLEVSNEIKGLSASFTVQLDSIESKVTGLNGQMSSITQTVDSITQRVQGLDGKYAEVQLTLDGLTIAGPSGQTLIKGSSIDTGSISANSIRADQVQLTGSITFSDLSTALYNQVNNSITASQAQTLINSTLVSSPNIAGGKFYNLQQTSWIEIGSDFGKYGLVLNDNTYSSTEPVFGVFNADSYYVSFDSKGETFLTVYSAGANAPACYPYGTWDFSHATIVGAQTLSLSSTESEPVVAMSSAQKQNSAKEDPIRFSNENGILKVKLSGASWYLDATGWHQ